MASSIEIFICYAREDENLRRNLEKQLRALKRQGLIDVWHDREIIPGADWKREIDKHLNTAQIILLLISPDFMDSDYCYSIEMKKAIERHERGEAIVIPIILRPVYFQGAPFGKLQALPTDAKPVKSKSWLDQDEAFFDIVKGILKVVDELFKYQWLNESKILHKARSYEEALTVYERITRLDPNCVDAYKGKGDTLYRLGRKKEALAAYEQAIRLDPNDALTYYNKGTVHHNLKHYRDALTAYEQAIRLDPNNALFHQFKGRALNNINNYVEALAAVEMSIRLNPNEAVAYQIKGDVLRNLEQDIEAIAAYDKAVFLKPQLAHAHRNKGNTLLKLREFEKAIAAYDEAIHYKHDFADAYRNKGRALEQWGKLIEAQQAYEKAEPLNHKG